MTDEQKAAAIRAYIAGIERVKKNSRGKNYNQEDFNREMDRLRLRLDAIIKLYQELMASGRQDLWEEFREWAEGLAS